MPYSRRSKFRHEERRSPRGFERIRTVTTRTGHELRIGVRRDGSTALISVLHPKRRMPLEHPSGLPMTQRDMDRRAHVNRQAAFYGVDARHGSLTYAPSKGVYLLDGRYAVTFHAHSHARPSHHVGPCSPACRVGRQNHAHRRNRR